MPCSGTLSGISEGFTECRRGGFSEAEELMTPPPSAEPKTAERMSWVTHPALPHELSAIARMRREDCHILLVELAFSSFRLS